MHPQFKEISKYFEAPELMVVASSQDNKPHTSTVFFCFDDDLNIYFLSAVKRRHSQEILKNPNVSVAIANHGVKWGGVMKGLQIEGTCAALTGEEARKAFQIYAKRFPKAKVLEEEFSGRSGKGNHRVWKVVPSKIKVWDERKYEYEGKVFEA